VSCPLEDLPFIFFFFSFPFFEFYFWSTHHAKNKGKQKKKADESEKKNRYFPFKSLHLLSFNFFLSTSFNSFYSLSQIPIPNPKPE